jgi:hypothetical protein
MCGCSEDIIIGQFPAPNKGIYVLYLHPGCVLCEINPSVIIRKHKNEVTAEHHGIDECIPNLQFIDMQDPDFNETKDTEISSTTHEILNVNALLQNFLGLYGNAVLPDQEGVTIKKFLTEIQPDEFYEIITDTIR